MSGIATGIAVAAGIGAAGSITSGVIGSNAAENAAQTQAQAAEQAEQTQAALGQESLTAEEQTQQQNRANEQPFLQTGANSVASLGYLMGVTPSGTVGGGTATPGQTLSIPGVNGSVTIPGTTPLTGTASTNLGAMGELMQAYPGGGFTAPTAAQAAASPGEQFALQQGEDALQAGASANGSLLTGGTGIAEQQYGQQLAATDYNNVYNQAMQGYNTNYNVWSNDKTNQFNRLAAMAGMGQTAAQTLGTQNLNSTGQIANTLTNTGQQIGQQMNNAGAATASGYIGSANALAGGLTGAGNDISQMMMVSQLMNNSGGGALTVNPISGSILTPGYGYNPSYYVG